MMRRRKPRSYHRIVSLEIVTQSRASPRARKDIVRREDIDGPYRNETTVINVDIPIGPDSSANIEVRRLISQHLRTMQGEVLFYVRAEFEPGRSGLPRYFKTIVPRTKITV